MLTSDYKSYIISNELNYMLTSIILHTSKHYAHDSRFSLIRFRPILHLIALDHFTDTLPVKQPWHIWIKKNTGQYASMYHWIQRALVSGLPKGRGAWFVRMKWYMFAYHKRKVVLLLKLEHTFTEYICFWYLCWLSLVVHYTKHLREWIRKYSHSYLHGWIIVVVAFYRHWQKWFPWMLISKFFAIYFTFIHYFVFIFHWWPAGNEIVPAKLAVVDVIDIDELGYHYCI